MRAELFDQILEERMAKIKKVMLSKAEEYAEAGGDRLHNFKFAGQRLSCSPERALIFMREKHEICIMDFLTAIDRGDPIDAAIINEKIGDSINYLILLEALLYERFKLIPDSMPKPDNVSRPKVNLSI